MTRNRRTRVAFHVFSGYEIRVILARDVAATGRRLNADLTGARGGHLVKPGSPEAWIVLGTDPDESTVAHEAAHAVRAMLRYVGVRVDDEVFAYHLDFLVGRIHSFIKKGKA
jgi:hypothetical protein